MTDLQTFTDTDGVNVSYRRWMRADDPRAVVLIAHGASEHSGRYERFATFLNDRGYVVFALDHRGHGATAAATGVGVAGARGWDGMVDDVHDLNILARHEVEGVPVILFAHSMGSFLAQLYAQRYGSELDGLVLSGSAGDIADMSETIAGLEAFVDAGAGGEAAPIFEPLNLSFEPGRTPFDWLSRDDAEVDKYIADPMCGNNAPLTLAFALEMLRGGREAWDPVNEQRIPDVLPILMITGELDPVSDGARTVRELEARYRAQGIADVTALYYADARHELLNEINRDEVQDDVVSWLDRVAGGG